MVEIKALHQGFDEQGREIILVSSLLSLQNRDQYFTGNLGWNLLSQRSSRFLKRKAL